MTAQALTNPRRPLKALTGLRFIAAMAVVLYHAGDVLAPGAPGPLARLVALGYLGVSLFFVLSGFILTYNYIEPGSGELRGTVREFWWARVARIYPTYLAALLLALPIFLLYRIVLAPPPARAEAAIAVGLTPLLLQAWWPRAACQWNCPAWSLSAEMFFYALFPFLAVYVARPGRKLWTCGAVSWAACIVIPAAFVILTPSGHGPPTRFDRSFWLLAAKFNPVAHLGEFLVGITTGLAFVRRAPSTPAARTLRWSIVGALLAVAAVLATRADLPYLFLHDGLLAPLWGAVIFVLALGGDGAARMLSSRPFVRLGEASYALYLVHLPILGFVVLARGFMSIRHPGAAAPPWLPLAAYLFLSIASALVLFDRLEEPARRRLRRWGTRRTADAKRSATSALRLAPGTAIE